MEEESSAQERVAKMLVNHLIDFKGCKRHTAVIGDDITGMQEFVNDRHKLLDEIPQFTEMMTFCGSIGVCLTANLLIDLIRSLNSCS